MSVLNTQKLSSAEYYYIQQLQICIGRDIYSISCYKLRCLAGFRPSDSQPHEERCQKEKIKTDSDLDEYIWQTCILYESLVPINGLHEMNFKTSLKSCTDQMLYWPELHRWDHAVINSVSVNCLRRTGSCVEYIQNKDALIMMDVMEVKTFSKPDRDGTRKCPLYHTNY